MCRIPATPLTGNTSVELLTEPGPVLWRVRGWKPCSCRKQTVASHKNCSPAWRRTSNEGWSQDWDPRLGSQIVPLLYGVFQDSGVVEILQISRVWNGKFRRVISATFYVDESQRQGLAIPLAWIPGPGKDGDLYSQLTGLGPQMEAEIYHEKVGVTPGSLLAWGLADSRRSTNNGRKTH